MMQQLFKFLDKLENQDLQYSIRRSRNDAIEVLVHISPCEYMEVEFFNDGHIEFQETTGISDVAYDLDAINKIDAKLNWLKDKE